MKRFRFLLVAVITILSIGTTDAQVLDPNFPDQVCLKENTRTRRPVPYTYLREADVMW